MSDKAEKGYCAGCGQNMKDKWPGIAHLMTVCPECCQEKAKLKPKTEYIMSGKNLPPQALRKEFDQKNMQK